MKRYLALAYEYKDSKGVYIGSDLDDVTNPNEAFLYINKDGTQPDKDECVEVARQAEKAHIEQLEESFDNVVVINYRPYTWLEYANLVVVEIDEETFHGTM